MLLVQYCLFFSDHPYSAVSGSLNRNTDVATNLTARTSNLEKAVKKNKRLTQKTRRLKNKVKTLLTALEECRNMMKPETYDDICDRASLISEKLLFLQSKKRNNTRSKVEEFDEDVRSFALSLHLKSSAAYNHVRRIFDNALPHERTLRR